MCPNNLYFLCQEFGIDTVKTVAHDDSPWPARSPGMFCSPFHHHKLDTLEKRGP